MTKKIALGGKYGEGKFALVDDCDYERISKYKWIYTKGRYTGYAVSGVLVDGKKVTLRMHRLIINAPSDSHVDHRDGDGLNNQRDNLRLCDYSQNMRNKRVHKNSSSKYKGVALHKTTGKWQANIQLNNQFYYLGLYESEIEAAKKYDAAARELFGEFALTNFDGTERIDRTEFEITPPSSSYRGVSWHKKMKRWTANIGRDGKQYWLGGFDSETEAAQVYDEAAKKLHGDLARLNFPEGVAK